jgi:hypothetical protein
MSSRIEHLPQFALFVGGKPRQMLVQELSDLIEGRWPFPKARLNRRSIG